MRPQSRQSLMPMNTRMFKAETLSTATKMADTKMADTKMAETNTAATTVATATNERTTFISLAREIRDAIYEFVLVETEPLTIPYTARSKPMRQRPTATREPPLLRVNRQICEEATPVHYSANAFESDYLTDTAVCFRRLSDAKLRLLRSVRPFYLAGMPEESTSSLYWPCDTSENCKTWVRELADEDGKGMVRRSAMLFPVVGEDGRVKWVRCSDEHGETDSALRDRTEGQSVATSKCR
ncbi:hypothetical protein LTR53_002395 [Teratosphaeriaceae sp. CCFEE 6253]|nr:hypothetical protein LTR53_002395 [Teratosphaeriaceae sp. CCFEE 6253]